MPTTDRPEAHPDSAPARPDRLPDGRDGRTVGEDSDGILDSLGKAVIAPVEGADEGAHRPGSAPPDDAPKPA